MSDIKIKNVFDWVKCITEHKQPWETYSDEDKALWNSYMVLKCFSMNQDYIEIVDVLNGYWSWTPERLYKCLCDLIPSGKYWFKYIKSNATKPNKELVEYLARYFQLSTREIKTYLPLINKDEQIQMLESMGIEQSEIKIIFKLKK